MSDSTTDEEERGSKRNAILTYREISAFSVKLAEISTKLDGLVVIGDDLEDLEVRVRALELAQAASSTRAVTWTNGLYALNTVILLVIAVATFFLSYLTLKGSP